ncbi:MAG: hypothetical protein BVN33_14675 [Proteobacteria bacterium ST_bin13]|nr:MAG: hypothetical protein BVN33_14675 [Proteobacteria bacterium ST_bin13]
MADQTELPLIDILAQLLATQTGQSLSQDYLTAQNAATELGEYSAEAPERAWAKASGDVPLSPGNAIEGITDLALILAPLMASARAGQAAYTALKTNPWRAGPVAKSYSEAIGPRIPKDAANYTNYHTDAAQEVLRRQLANPSRHMNHASVKKDYLSTIDRKGLNAGPQDEQLDDMIKGTLRRIDPQTNLENPASIEAAIQAATGIRRNGVPKTLSVTGAAVGAGAAAEEQSLMDWLRGLNGQSP